MKLPTGPLRVLQARYRVELVPGTDIGDAYGTTVPARRLIRLGREQAEDSLRDTLLHEMLHACVAETGIPALQKWDGDLEEQVIRALTPVLLHTLCANPSYTRFILGWSR